MPLNQQSNHGMAVLHYSLQNGERTLQADVQQGFKILPTRFLIHYISCCAAPLSRLRAAEGRQSHTICRQLRSSTVSISPLLHLLSSKRNNAELKYCVKKQCVLDLLSSSTTPGRAGLSYKHIEPSPPASCSALGCSQQNAWPQVSIKDDDQLWICRWAQTTRTWHSLSNPSSHSTAPGLGVVGCCQKSGLYRKH